MCVYAHASVTTFSVGARSAGIKTKYGIRSIASDRTSFIVCEFGGFENVLWCGHSSITAADYC